jgi:hypothetical protein
MPKTGFGNYGGSGGGGAGRYGQGRRSLTDRDFEQRLNEFFSSIGKESRSSRANVAPYEEAREFGPDDPRRESSVPGRLGPRRRGGIGSDYARVPGGDYPRLHWGLDDPALVAEVPPVEEELAARLPRPRPGQGVKVTARLGGAKPARIRAKIAQGIVRDLRKRIATGTSTYGGSRDGGGSRGGGNYGSSYGSGGYKGGTYGGAGGASINQGVGGAYKNR